MNYLQEAAAYIANLEKQRAAAAEELAATRAARILGGLVLRGTDQLGLGSGAFAVRVSFHDDVVGVVGQPVEGGVGHDRVGEQGQPVAGGPVGGDHDGAAQVAFGDHLIEVLGLEHGHGFEAEVVEN